MRWVFFSLLAVNCFILMELTAVTSFLKPRLALEAAVEDNSDNVRSLVLLSEMERDRQSVDTIRLNTRNIIEGSQPVQALSRSLCTLIGSFVSIDKANRFVDVLAARGVSAKVKNLLVSSTVGFWLHLPPLVSRKEVLRRLSELQRQGVDSYIIPDGDLENGISLGMFSDQNRALLLKDNIEQLGYQPKIAEVPREKREVWVFLEQSESVKISAEQWLELISGRELLQKQQNLCSDVASA